MTPRILIAGIGNIFLGDDAFGVEAARRLSERSWPAGVRVVDFGIRGLDLAYALTDGLDAAILVDAMPRGGPPGILYVIEPELAEPGTAGALVEAHGMDPVQVLRVAQTLGGPLPRLRIVGCEPATLGSDDDPALGLSEAVQGAVDEAVRLVEALVQEMYDSCRPVT